jgi:hypothetical protein
VKHVPYDIAADFAPVTLVVRAPQLLMVHPSVPAKSTAELIALAKKQQGRLNYGSGGLGSASHLAAAVFASMAGISITHIPYKGVGLAFVDLVGGQLDLSFPAIPSGVPYMRSGRLRARRDEPAPACVDSGRADDCGIRVAGIPGAVVVRCIGAGRHARRHRDAHQRGVNDGVTRARNQSCARCTGR